MNKLVKNTVVDVQSDAFKKGVKAYNHATGISALEGAEFDDYESHILFLFSTDQITVDEAFKARKAYKEKGEKII
jgi:hypothetical protein